MKSKRHVRPTANATPASNEETSVPLKKLKPSLPEAPAYERDVALEFAARIQKRFDNLVKATILFGSQATHTATSSSDIDVVIIVDDVSVNWDLELTAWYREELGKVVATYDSPRELHVNTIKLSTWWNDLMYGDPVVLNIIRYGEALIDIGGFFKTQKALLAQGKIHATPEAVYNALQRAPLHLARSKHAELGAIEGIYWTMVDSAQAALMTAGLLPPSPEHVPQMLKETFVDKGLIKSEIASWYRDIYGLHKAIIHGHIKAIKGADIDIWQVRAEVFLKQMTSLIDQYLEAGKAQS
jgi:predicted nucleotidyltransferase/uncharacterized protein (UPF0332 family)